MPASNPVQPFLADAQAFIEKAAPTVETTLIADAKSALAAIESAFTPVADAAVVSAVAMLTARFAVNAPFSQAEIAALEGLVAQLQTMLPKP